jgi:hypothetical protein
MSSERVKGTDTQIGEHTTPTAQGSCWQSTYYERVYPSGKAVLVMKTITPDGQPRFATWGIPEFAELCRVVDEFRNRRHAAHVAKPLAPRYETAARPGQPRGKVAP